MSELLRFTAEGIDKCVQDLSTEFETPSLVDIGNGFVVFRHRRRDEVLASFLKTVRIASLLNASLVLLDKGYIQEVYALCRMIDEASEDIFFLAVPLSPPGLSKDQQRFIEEFFQEEYSDPADPVTSLQKRDRVPRKTIQSAIIHKLPVEGRNSGRDQAVSRTLFQAFSGYVHGAYGQIMDLYGGLPPRYHTRGMQGTPREKECSGQLVSYFYRALVSIELVADRVGLKDVADRLTDLSIGLGRGTECVDQAEIERMEQRRKRRSSQG